jgi:hypothetical protein
VRLRSGDAPFGLLALNAPPGWATARVDMCIIHSRGRSGRGEVPEGAVCCSAAMEQQDLCSQLHRVGYVHMHCKAAVGRRLRHWHWLHGDDRPSVTKSAVKKKMTKVTHICRSPKTKVLIFIFILFLFPSLIFFAFFVGIM